jgi:arylsulfatase A-like enzyme
VVALGQDASLPMPSPTSEPPARDQRATLVGGRSARPRGPRLDRRAAIAARGALAGLVGGAAAGAVDFALAAGRAAAFLPSGRGALLAFLIALYGAAGAALGLALAVVGRALFATTDLGRWAERSFAGDGGDGDGAGGVAVSDGRPPSEGAPIGALIVSAATMAVAHGAAARALTLDAIARFRHPGLIAALVGAEAAGLAIVFSASALALAAIIGRLAPVGPRLSHERPSAPAHLAAALVLALVGAAGIVAAVLQRALVTPRLAPWAKALWAAITAPLASLLALALAVAVARALRGRAGPRARRPATTVLAAALALILPGALAAAVAWPTVRQLDLRPFVALAVALAVAALAALRTGASRFRLDARPLALRALVAAALVALPLSAAISIGRADRVRKAASAFTGATAPIVRAIQRAFDLDRDGASSVLGGGDCDDLDRDVHPGAFDWPDDGIDQDCNGHAATVTPPPPRRYAAVPDAVPQRPNVLLLTIDALRADHVGAWGYPRPTTPRLDELARESTRFAHAWAHAPSTRYSVPAILTGRYPSNIVTTLQNWPPRVMPENRLLAEILHDLGYTTGALLSYHYFNRGWGLDQGFDDYDFSLQHLHSIGGDPAKTAGTSARPLADKAVAWIQAHAPKSPTDKPFFLWAHFYDTHFMFERHPELPESNFGSTEIDLYDGEIRFTDHHVGRVLDALHDAGLWDSTIIIVTSDHGEGFGEHGLPPSQRHGYHLYRNETDVPLLVRVPGLPARVVDAPVGHVDILPTLLNALRVPADQEPQLLGQSLFGLMTGAAAEPPPPVAGPLGRVVYQEVTYEGPTVRRAVAARGWHFIANVIPDDTRELYDLAADPTEERDRAGTGDSAEATLRAALGEWTDAAALPPNFRDKVAGNIGRSSLNPKETLGDTVGGWFTVEGVDVETPRPRAGETLRLAIHLRGGKRPPDGWRLFTHVIGSDGRRLNADHEPLVGVYPITRLGAGTWLRDPVEVALPPGWPPGPTRVEIGAWRGAERAPIVGPHSTPDRSVRVATVEIQP